MKERDILSLPHATLSPLAASERIQAIDILRGLALFGVLAANMRGFSWPAAAYYNGDAYSFPHGIDAIVEALILIFIRYKAVALLSFLFGLGFSVQMLRATERGEKLVPLYLRKSLALFAFGLVHLLFLWFLDILTSYALTSVVLLLFRNSTPKALRRWVVALFVILPVVVILTSGDSSTALLDNFNRSVDVHQHGSYADVFRLRLSEIADEVLPLQNSLATLLATLIYFLMGLYAGKMHIFQNPRNHLSSIRTTSVWGLFIGLPAGIFYVIGRAFFPTSEILSDLSEFAFAEFGPLLFLAYAGAILMLLQRDSWKKRLSIFAPVGRMALTNYLLQSLICTTLFNGYGLGLFGRVGSTAGLSLAVAIFCIQVAWSAWWFRRFQFGLLEWIWRSLTYGKAPRLPAPSALR